MGVLQGAALDFAEGSGYDPSDVDAKGWTLLHHAASESQHRRGMLAAVRGLVEVMPTELVIQGARGGMPRGWSAFALSATPAIRTTDALRSRGCWRTTVQLWRYGKPSARRP